MNVIEKLKGFDLNLLTVFLAVDEYRHVTRAAKALGITQPALSHALARLRGLLNDQLFVKSSQGMVPTPRAQQLVKPIRDALKAFEQDVLGAAPFEPRSLKRTFRIYTTDFLEILLLPTLLKTLAVEAPQVQVITRPTSFSLPREELEVGVCDVAIAGFFGKLPDGFYQQKLFTDRFASAVRHDHPRLAKKRKVTVRDFCAERHLLAAPGGELRGRVDELLKEMNCERFIAAGVQSFTTSSWLLPSTDCIFTGPSKLIDQMSRGFSLHTFAPPVEVPEITIVQAWHERNHTDPGHKWFRGQIARIFQA